jgi:N-acetylglucosamine malate deacetylase 2
MASILYVFPHPDDESFGPAPALVSQLRAGHEVHLLTLTRGGATKQRHELGLDIDEMGAIRLEEMRCVERTLGLTSMRVLDLPDGGLPDLDPADIEAVIEDTIRATSPDVLVTYAVHGISGHPDHLVAHAAVKSVFCRLRGSEDAPARLALFTLRPDGDEGRPAHLKGSAQDRIAVRVKVSEEELATGSRALACYETYRSVVEEHKPMNEVRDGVYFELFQESKETMLSDITEDLPDNRKGTPPRGISN